jgi:hypothetical protein
MKQDSNSLPWDVKHYLTSEELTRMSEPILQCANRHAHLVGDIPFQSLYTMPFRELVPQVLPRLQQLSVLGQHEQEDNWVALVSSLQSELGNHTLVDLATRPRKEFSPSALNLLSRMKKAGFSLPQPTDDAVLLPRRIAAKRGLLAAVPTATLKSVLDREPRDPEIQAVIQEAQNSGVLPAVIFPSYCDIGFFSWSDGKDFDSLLTVTLYNPAQQRVAEVSSDFGEFPSSASVGPFPMPILGGAIKSEQELKDGTLSFGFLPNGNDVWLFTFFLNIGFPDGTHYSVSGPQNQGPGGHYVLTQDIRSLSIDLSTLVFNTNI